MLTCGFSLCSLDDASCVCEVIAAQAGTGVVGDAATVAAPSKGAAQGNKSSCA